VAYRYLSLARVLVLLIVLLGIGAAWLANFPLFGVGAWRSATTRAP
jgi:hypothetical protein